MPAQSAVPNSAQFVPEFVLCHTPPLGAHAIHRAVSTGSMTTRLTLPAPPTSGRPGGVADDQMAVGGVVLARRPARSNAVSFQRMFDEKSCVAPG